MAAPWECLDDSQTRKYQESLRRLLFFHFQEDEQSKTTLNLLLDEIVSVDPLNCPLQGNMKESALLAKLSRQVPFHHDRLVAKTCILIHFFCEKKSLPLSDTDLDAVVCFLTEGLQRCQSFVHIHLLNALSVVIIGNAARIQKYHDTLVGAQGILLQLTDYTTCDEEVVVEAVRGIVAITTVKVTEAHCLDVCHLSACFDTLVHLLHHMPHLTMATSLQHKLLVQCFSGIQNIMVLKRVPNVELGVLFAAVRAYMFYGLTSHTVNIPAQLYPTMVTPLVSVGPAKAVQPPVATGGSQQKPSGTENMPKGGGANKGKARKNRKKKGREMAGDALGGENQNATDELPSASAWSCVTPRQEAESWEQTWLRISSDSEFSEAEGSVTTHHQPRSADSVRVRQSALNCFLNVIRNVDKKVMFGFWSSFIPDAGASSPHLQSLFTTVLKDPSPKCRMAAVACLTNMLDLTRPLLAAAEEISTTKPAFSSFSSILGSMVREMHRCLLQALVAENYKAVLTQIIKCLGCLVNNAPYHRLNPGLLTRVLKCIRHFFNHKDPNVRTACLTCIGSMVGIKPPLLEVSDLIKPPRPPVGINRTPNPGDSPLLRPEDAYYLLYPVYTAPKVADVQEEETGELLINHDGGKADQPSLSIRADEVSSTGELLINLDGGKADQPSLSIRADEVSSTGELLINLDGGKADQPSLSIRADEVSSMSGLSLACDSKSVDVKDNHSNKSVDVKDNNSNKSVDVKDNNSNTGKEGCGLIAGSVQERLGRELEQKSLNSSVDGRSVHTKVPGADSGSSSCSVDSVTPVLGAQSGSDTPIFSDRLLQAYARETSWVIKLCLKSINGQSDSTTSCKLEPLPIRLEALQVMGNLVKNYFPVIRHSFRLLQELTQTCFDDPNYIIVFHGTKVLDELTQVLQKDVQDALLAPNHVIPKQQILEFWLMLLESPLPRLLSLYHSEKREGTNFVCSGACECMANIGDEIFTQLPRPRQMQCVTLVLGLAQEADRLIKGTAVRALGVYVGYSALKDDVAFVMDAAKAILTAMVPVSNSVRLKASWAMANLCDTLVDNKIHNPDTDFCEDFPDSVLLELVQRAGVATKETDKISCNAARAVGNLLRYLPVHCFSQAEMLAAIDVAVKGLTKNMNCRTMKVRWNSCYAASNVFKNRDFPVDQAWRKDILLTLCEVVHKCTNFKVRINAALAISSPASRKGYCSSDVFATIWSSLVTSLETSENISDFAEFRYRDSLIEHICGAILHLTKLIDIHDLGAMSQSVNIQGHTLRTYMEKYIRMTLSEKTQSSIPSVDSVKECLKTMLETVGSDVDRRCLHSLVQTMEPDADAAEEIMKFKQVYD